MSWFRQTPFVAVVVFSVGVGLGLAWKRGWIPVELGSANTGSLSDSPGDTPREKSQLSSAAVSQDSASVAAEIPPDDPRLFAQPSATEIVRLESVSPELLEPAARNVDRLPNRSNAQPERISAATQEDEMEWAAEPSQKSASKILPRPVGLKSGERPKLVDQQIQRVSNQEASSRKNADPAIEAVPSDTTMSEQLHEVDEQIANDEFLPAHRTLSKLYWSQKEVRNELLSRLERTSRAIFFEPYPHFVDPYVVQPNDKLTSIASKYQLSWEYVRKLNRVDPRRIQLGQKLKILKGPFAAVVDLNDYSLTVHLNGYFVRRYSVGIGKDGASPVGKFAVLNKVENPQYTGPDGKVISADDPTNPLGERWIDLGDSYGIHGTIDPDSIGKAASRGCIRMREKDVIEVYDFLVKGSEVVIRK